MLTCIYTAYCTSHRDVHRQHFFPHDIVRKFIAISPFHDISASASSDHKCTAGRSDIQRGRDGEANNAWPLENLRWSRQNSPLSLANLKIKNNSAMCSNKHLIFTWFYVSFSRFLFAEFPFFLLLKSALKSAVGLFLRSYDISTQILALADLNYTCITRIV